jgi:transcriptional regulator with XRE-family HTH domain
MNPKPTFASELRRLRRENGLDLVDLAVAAGVSVSYVSEIERGTRNPPTNAAIAAMLGRVGASSELDRMLKLAAAARKSIDIPVNDDTADSLTDMLVALQRSVNECALTEDTAKKILGLINKQGGTKRP